MAGDDKEITIRIAAKNLTAAEFAAARREVAGLSDATEKTTTGMSGGLKKAHQDANTLSLGIGRLAASFTLAGLLERGAVALINWGREAMQAASVTTDLANKYRVSTDAVQKFSFAADQSGASVDTLLRGAQQLARRLAEGDDSARGAVERLGLSFDALRTLSPDQQFQQVAAALADVEDEGQQTALAMDLFGKSGTETLGAINNGLSELMAQAPVTNEAVVAALDNIGDAWSAFIAGQKSGFQEWAGLWAVLLTEGPSKTLQVYRELSGEVPPKIAEITNLLGHQANAAKAVSMSESEMDRISKELTRSVEQKTKKIDEGRIATERAAKAEDDFLASIDGRKVFTEADKIVAALNKVGGATSQTVAEARRLQGPIDAAIEKYHALGVDAPPEVQKVADELRILTQDLLESRLQVSNLWEAFKQAPQGPLTSTFDPMASLSPLRAAMTSNMGGRGIGGALLDDLKSTLTTGLGPTLIQAFTGGGKPIEAAGALAGVGLAQSLSGSLLKSAPGFMSSALGGVLNSVLPGVGALMGPLLGKVFNGIKGVFGGVSPEVKAVRLEVDQFQVSLANTLTATQRNEAGNEGWKMSSIAVRDALRSIGESGERAGPLVEQLWDTDHPERARAAMVEINRVLAAQETQLEANRDELVALNAEYESLRADGTLSLEQLQEEAQFLGADLAALGPAFNAQRLTEETHRFVDAWDAVKRGQLDLGGILSTGRQKWIDLGQEAIRYGVVLPENLRDAFAELDRGNLLVDEHGNKLLDITQLQFGEAVASKWDMIADRMLVVGDRILQLTDLLARRLPAAAQAGADVVEHVFANQIPDAINEADYALDGFLYGRSPGGLKDIPILSVRGGQAIRVLADGTIQAFDEMEGSVGRFEGKLAGVSSSLGSVLEQMRFVRDAGFDLSDTGVPAEKQISHALASGEWLDVNQAIARAQAAGGGTLTPEDIAAMGEAFGQREGLFRTSDVDRFLQEFLKLLPNFNEGSDGIRDFGRGRLALLHGRERVQTESQMRRERAESSVVNLTLHVVVDDKGGRTVSPGEFRTVVQGLLDAGQLRVPARVVSARVS